MSTATPSTSPKANVSEIRRALDVLFQTGNVVELRAFKSRRCTISGYYDNFDKLASDAAKVNRVAGGVYITLNQIDPALLARRVNRYEEFVAVTTSDNQVTRRRWFPIDVDPKRPAGISASNDEHEAAIEKARVIRRYLVEERGWPEPGAADSGNGAHLLFRIDLPIDDESRQLVENGLKALDQKFSDGQSDVDTGVSNASRIWKLYGTATGKGDHTEDRPHRVAKLLHLPDDIATVSVEQLRSLAGERESTPAPVSCDGNGAGFAEDKLDVPAWLTEKGVEFLVKGKTGSRGQTIYALAKCPFDESHADGDACVMQDADGKLSAKCFHNSCSEKGWQEFKEAIGAPGRAAMQHTRNDAPHSGAGDTRSKNAGKMGLVSPSPEPLPWKPFPTEVLPEPAAGLIRAGAKAMGCDESFVALPLLAGLGSAIGATCRIELKPGWCEPAVVWTVIVGESGTLKSPALSLALEPLKRLQAYELDRYPELLQQYEQDKALFDADMSAWKRNGRTKGEPLPEKPEEPRIRRYLVSDITIEALADRLQDAPRGLLAACDELAGWLGSFARYKAGSQGSDVSQWLSIHRADGLLVDRKSGTKTIHIRRAAVSLTGSIQPDILRRALGVEHMANGLAARLLLAMPPRTAKTWTDAAVDLEIKKDINRLFGRLLAIQFRQGEDDEQAPIDIPLSVDGKRAWVAFYDAHAREQTDLVGELAAAWSKLEGYAARLALIVHLIRVAADDPTVDINEIDADSVRSGAALVDWFGHEAKRVYQTFGESDEDRDRRQLVELIRRKGGKITARDLQRSTRRFRGSAKEAEKVLTGLVELGLGSWFNVVDTGGRPATVFRLSGMESGDTGTPNPGGNGTSVTGDKITQV